MCVGKDPDGYSLLTVVISGNGMIIFYFIKIKYFIKIFIFAYLDFFLQGVGGVGVHFTWHVEC